MQPALSREEAEQVVWTVLNEDDHGSYRTTRDLITDLMARLGFTREDVRALGEAARELANFRPLGVLLDNSAISRLFDIGNRIEALLPPED